MENYQKGKVVEKEVEVPIPGLPSDLIEMKVKDGSKIRNLMGFALGRMEAEHVRQIAFSGSGKALGKVITCVEIMKRKIQDMHQITKICFKEAEEIWEPIVPEVGLDALTVKRNIPAIFVLLSKDQLDVKEPGYQAPASYDTLWIQELKEETVGQKRRRAGAARGGLHNIPRARAYVWGGAR
uniref:Ribonuclease P/MRP subunit p25 like n=1 Tax=Leptobrachium leishanense TaxID=445787 RepID=A0A8C5PSX7_9ANUR